MTNFHQKRGIMTKIITLDELKKELLNDDTRKSVVDIFKYKYIFVTEGFMDAAGDVLDFFKRNKNNSDYEYKIFKTDLFIENEIIKCESFKEL